MTDFLEILRKRFPGASVLEFPSHSDGRRAQVVWTVGPQMFVDVDGNGDWTIELVPTTSVTITAAGFSLNRCLERLHEVLLVADLNMKLLKGNES